MIVSNRKLVPYNKNQLRNLRAVIKGCAQEALEIRQKEIRKLSGMDKWKAQKKKRNLGHFTRHHLLVYAFLRGQKYLSVESKRECQPLQKYGGLPFGSNIDVEYLYNICKLYVSWTDHLSLTKENFSLWILDAHAPFFTKEEMKAKREAEATLKSLGIGR